MSYFSSNFEHDSSLKLSQKFFLIHWVLLLLIIVISCIGFLMLYSAASGSLDPWSKKQMIRFSLGLCVMFFIAFIDIRLVLKFAYVFYVVSLLMLLGVEVIGSIGMGAQRWIRLGFINIQPSEVMKITLILALARYFHGLSFESIGRIRYLILPLCMVLLPFFFIVRQPDLGTALLILAGGGSIFWLSGVRLWKFVFLGVSSLCSVPIIWGFLRPYQKNRILTFLDPERDPLGSGYHILQSKIALGSGGMTGKGFLLGSQSHLNFLPEKQTDFIFTMLSEEFGFMGGAGLLCLYALLLMACYHIAFRSRNQFSRLMSVGLANIVFLYVFINVAMVIGLVPVVGIPLPLISYGGTSMLTLMFLFGLLMNVWIHRHVEISRYSIQEIF